METRKPEAPPSDLPQSAQPAEDPRHPDAEVGGPKGPEPTRYGDWENDGICRDF